MTDTGFYVPKEKLGRFASFYTYDKNGKLEVTRDILVPNFLTPPALPSGGGGLTSTARDYMRFCQMLLNGGELDGIRLLSPLSVKLMRTNMLPASARQFQSGTGFGLDFAVLEEPAAAGGYGGEGTFYWGGAAGHLVLDRSCLQGHRCRDDPAPRAGKSRRASDFAIAHLSGDHRHAMKAAR